ncbi:hypothetical protein N7495_001356 [Penicillium taxi]|uniref:uncharacterized protein n=1 Tax=Penicillium taxi TaxID=168475 RepID=UPI0025455098|nr:uncharacterized protein N7495_001356 [Penicillium taxi]KAJ5908674.1 hypothetical protein N7495_001356 [Penicillium taxi]
MADELDFPARSEAPCPILTVNYLEPDTKVYKLLPNDILGLSGIESGENNTKTSNLLEIPFTTINPKLLLKDVVKVVLTIQEVKKLKLPTIKDNKDIRVWSGSIKEMNNADRNLGDISKLTPVAVGKSLNHFIADVAFTEGPIVQQSDIKFINNKDEQVGFLSGIPEKNNKRKESELTKQKENSKGEDRDTGFEHLYVDKDRDYAGPCKTYGNLHLPKPPNKKRSR